MFESYMRCPYVTRGGGRETIHVSNADYQRHFGGAPDVVGRRITINEQRCVVVGVMPPDLDYPRGVDIWRATRSIPANSAFGIAAQREVNYLRRRFNIVVRPFAEVVIGDVRRTMIGLFGAVAFVLLIASANVANLLLMRGEGRGRELALRAALGAARGRIAGRCRARCVCTDASRRTRADVMRVLRSQ